ncbi:MAG: (d)CMP kinase [Actinobacteria bacterium]|nr:(d)CMP kinase [Actinomycetota bacterium]
MDKNNIITIDGPAGSGKSTIAKLLSKELGFKYIDTGAMYRTITLLALENKIDLKDEKSILMLAKKSRIKLEGNPEDENNYTIVLLNNRDVTDKIRSREVGEAVSIVSKLSGVRKFLVKMQRELAKDGKAVLEGRDTGSVVCPDAVLKIYLTAGMDERIKRRKNQNKQKGYSFCKKVVKNEIINRDRIDSTRKDSPLIIPEDAVVIDSTNMSISQTFERIKEIYYERIYSKN